MRSSPNGGSRAIGAVIMTITVCAALMAMVSVTGGARPLMSTTTVVAAQPHTHPAQD
jgi:hypothetical protein